MLAARVVPDRQTHLQRIAGIPQQDIAGVEVAIMFKPSAEKETVKLSFRSRRLNVSDLARSLGGGGHARAAGCTLKGSVYEVKPRVLTRVMEALREAGL